jgi:ankyrin repeat protein
LSAPRSQDGRASLHLAAYQGHLELVKLLLTKGANVTATTAVRPHACILGALTAAQPPQLPATAARAPAGWRTSRVRVVLRPCTVLGLRWSACTP